MQQIAVSTKPVALESVRALRKNLRVLEREFARSLSPESTCCGVTLAQCHLLLEVEERGETGVTELAAALELDKSTLSRTVDGMWHAGMLSRETDPSNRRRQVVKLTEEGRAKARSINTGCDEYYAGLIGSIPPDKRSVAIEGVTLLAAAMNGRKHTSGGRS
jgi:DNA-binding MarR family transcriptional regulator